MSEQVQVREGVWKTREGEEIEVRARDTTGFNTEWRWEGKRRGYYNTWRDDGTIHIEREQKEGDLVRFLRPLPDVEPEPTPEPAPEPQPVQVREGVWLTREGHEVEVRERDANGPTRFRWVGLVCGVRESWRDDGRCSLKNEINHRDLVAYVGPLPQQTTTDTLAEIEEQVADIEQHDEAHTLRAELAQATAERDILAQRLVTEPSEEALQKENSRQQIQINTLQDQLADMTDDRETLRRQFAAMTADRDRLQAELARETESLQNERFQAQTAHAGCKRAEEYLDEVTAQLTAMTADRDEQARLRETLDSTCRHLGGEAKYWKNRAQEISDCMAVQITRAERAEAQVRELRIELDAEGETPANNRRAIADAHLIGAQTGRQAAFEAVERWLEPLAAVDSEHAAAVLQALPGCIRKLAELEGVTW